MKTSTFISAPAALALLILSTIAGAQDSGTGARVWTLQECIDYALENNITVKQNVNTYLSGLISVSDLLVKLSFRVFFPLPELHPWARPLLDDISFTARNMVIYLSIAGIAVAEKMTQEWYKNEAARRKIEKDKAEAELQNLKSQVNPHFLFNTLNNIFSLIQIDQDKAQEAVHEVSGMELSKMLPQGTKLIITTAFSDYAIEGYKVHALGYLLKPISYGDFLAASIHARDVIDKGKLQSSAPKSEKSSIFVKSEYRLQKIDFADIVFIEGLKDYVKIYLDNGAEPVLTLTRMKNLEEQLPSPLSPLCPHPPFLHRQCQKD